MYNFFNVIFTTCHAIKLTNKIVILPTSFAVKYLYLNSIQWIWPQPWYEEEGVMDWEALRYLELFIVIIQ